MKYLKTYEGLFDFLKRKKKHEPDYKIKDFIPNIEDCLNDLSDDDFFTDVTASDGCISVYFRKNKVTKFQFVMGGEGERYERYSVSDVIDSIRFINSFIDDLGLKIVRIDMYISGEFDGTNYLGDIYYEDLEHLEEFNREDNTAKNNIQYSYIRIQRK